MASTCKVYENNEDLGSEALVPVINLHKMRKYNQREEINEQVALLKAEVGFLNLCCQIMGDCF